MKEREDKSESTLALEPNRLNSRHRALMRKLISGMTLSQACEDLGFSISRASIVVNSPLFQEEMKRMESDLNTQFIAAEAEKQGKAADPVHTLLVESAEVAARTLKGALDDQNGAIRISAARDILDRTGYGKEDKLKARIVVEPSQSLVDVVTRIVKEKGSSLINKGEGNGVDDQPSDGEPAELSAE